MPEQTTTRGVPITDADLSAPFETPTVRFGAKGVQLKLAADLVDSDSYLQLTNALHKSDGKITARPGLNRVTGAFDSVHSIRRLNSPDTNTFTHVFGVGTFLATGNVSMTSIDSGYSGDPMTLLPYRPPLSSEAWMFVGDRARVRKVRPDGLDLPIGLPAPSNAATSSVFAQETTPICQFNSTDASDAAQWTNNPGFDFSSPPNPTDVPVTTDSFGMVGSSVQFKANPSTTNAVFNAGKGYYSFWGLAKTLNLSVVGSQVASDDDLFHLWAMFSHPDLTAEFRIYFVVSATFDPAVLPGTDFTGANGDFYLKTWRQNDFAAFLQSRASQIDAAEVARVRAVRDQDLKNRRINDTRASWAQQRAAQDPYRVTSLQTGAGRNQWEEYGVVGTPVRRGDFQRVGATAGRDWSTITGIIVYLQTQDGTGGETAVWLNNSFLGGGYGPDTAEPGAQQYDYRYTHYDPRTGAEGNPSPTMNSTAFVDSLRQRISVGSTAYGDGAVRQRFYRRGGSLIADWYFLGQNSGDGGSFTDDLTDDDIINAGTVELDNDAFVTSIDANGNAVYGQPLPVLFGPVQDLIFATGDPLRPGDVYWCKPGQPDSWPAANHVEITSPSEPLMNGGVFAGQAFVFSTERGYVLYPSLMAASTAVTGAPTECKKGLISRWGMAIGVGAIWFVAKDGVYATTGGPAQLISDDIRPLFDGQTVQGYAPIDLTQLTKIRLAVHNFELIFFYQDTNGAIAEWRYSTLYKFWRPIARVTKDPRVAYSDEVDTDGGTGDLYYGANTAHAVWTESGTSDDGEAITVTVKSPDSDFGRPREDKRLGDLYIDLDRGDNVTVNIVPALNHSAVVNATEQVTIGSGRQRYILSPFGTEPQQARTASLTVSWTTTSTPPILYQWGMSLLRQPDLTMDRVTQWEDSETELYLTGVTIDVDTNGGPKQFYVEYDDAATENTWRTLGPFTLTHTMRHKASFSWPVVKAKLRRIRPVDDCTLWQLFRVDWIAQPEPPRIAHWDLNYENVWDNYLTGIDLDCDTFGATKTLEVRQDQAVRQTFTINVTGRQIVHLTVQPPVRGHLLRLVATDENPGLLYTHRWQAQAEPSEQTNWNQNFSSWGADTDKWLKAIVFQCDTFAQDKTVEIQIDGVTVETLTVNADGRSVVELALPAQHKGRVFRFIPTDANPGRIYNITPYFDLEPLSLTRWETQEVTGGIDGWKSLLYADVTLRSTLDVTLTVTAYNQSGGTVVKTYTIPGTMGAKIPRFVPLEGTVGWLYKFLLTSAQPFYLYREETRVTVVPWGDPRRREIKPFGNDDLDPSRGMGQAALAAATPGGQLV